MATSRLLNRAQISYTFNGSASSAVSNQTSTTLLDKFTMKVTKDALSKKIRAGSNAAYVVRVENNGVGTLYNISACDDLGAENHRQKTCESEHEQDHKPDYKPDHRPNDTPLTYVEGSAAFYLNGTEIEGTAETKRKGVMFETDTPLEPGDNLLIIYLAELDSSQTERAKNKVTVTAATDSDRTITESDTAKIEPVKYADVSIFKTADRDTVVSGDTLTYTFTLMNTGYESVDEITFTDEFPEEFTITSVSYTVKGDTMPVSEDDYSVTDRNSLTLPAENSELVIGIPASSRKGPGITTITVSGTIA